MTLRMRIINHPFLEKRILFRTNQEHSRSGKKAGERDVTLKAFRNHKQTKIISGGEYEVMPDSCLSILHGKEEMDGSRNASRGRGCIQP